MGENIFSKSITVLVFMSMFIAQQALGQFTDNFNDGDLTQPLPAWSGDESEFIVNGAFQLQTHINPAAAGSSILSKPFSIPNNHNTKWEFYISHTFSSSNANNSRVYLMSNAADFNGMLNGYYLQFGEDLANDAVRLVRQTGNTLQTLVSGPAAQISGPFTVRVRVTRSAIGEWQLSIDALGGNNFVPTPVVIDNTFTTSSFFGVRCLYTLSNTEKFFFDDFIVETTPAPDVTPPQLTSITAVTSTQIDLNFAEEVDDTDPLASESFILNDTVLAVFVSFENAKFTLRLTFGSAMENGHVQKIFLPEVSDLFGNVREPGPQNFLYFEPVGPQPNDIVITEVYPDPSPSLGLPPYEFIEIYNRSQNPFQLQDWQITDGSTNGVLTNRILLPKQYLILTPNEAVVSYNPFGSTMGMQHFPSLNNAGDQIKLKSAEGVVIDSLVYTLAAYNDEEKDNGGYTLERIDPTNFCKGIANWKASENSIGGSPGLQNSVHHITPDHEGPKLLEVVPKEANVVTLTFDERLAEPIPALENFSVPHPLQIVSSVFSNADHSQLDLTFSLDLDSTTTYTITLANFFDCPGNPMLDEFSSSSFMMDVVKPRIDTIVIKASGIEIAFSERIDPLTISESVLLTDHPAEYDLLLAENKKLLYVEFSEPFVNGQEYVLTVQNVSDLSGNKVVPVERIIRFFESHPVASGDIVINEFFADPSPMVGLPEGEFIELHNRSGNAIDVSGWTITDGSTIATLSNKIVLPNTHIILCPSAFSAAYSAFGPTMGLNIFPSLNNSADKLKLVNTNGVTIDSIHYQLGWYYDDDKKDGGWSIERINPNDFCSESENWKASVDEKGGTPGSVNSVFALTEDVVAPDFIDAIIVGRDTVVLSFDEGLASGVDYSGNFLFDPAVKVDTLHFTDDSRRSIGVKFESPMDSLLTYQITMQNIFDCPGNALHPDSAIFDFKLDNIQPEVQFIDVVDSKTVTVRFTKKIKAESVTVADFLIDEVDLLKVEMKDQYTVEVVSYQALTNGKNYRMMISGIMDLSGNISKKSEHTILFFQSSQVFRKDLIISEIFADPTPSQGLPETEFVEILNRSQNPIQLANWSINDQTQGSKIKPHIILPGEYLILTSASKGFQFQNAMGVLSFPTLTNAGEALILKDSLGVTIDSVFYSDEWYHESEKKDGGWSLELIDPNNICAEGENWTASEDPAGGTPGKVNSVSAEKPDLTPPEIISVVAISADTIVVSFNEKMSREIPPLNAIVVNPVVNIERIIFPDQTLRSYAIVLSTPLENRVRYSIVMNNISDCAGNTYRQEEPFFFALPEKSRASDIIVNEILFNPRPTGVDFVELFNRSEKYINLKNLQVANQVNDTIVNRKKISEGDFVFEPGDYLVLTSDPNLLKGEYLQSVEDKLKKTVLPTLSDDEGSIVILDEQDQAIDIFSYSDDQHSPFLKDTEGVSLERVDIHAPSSNKNNWQSASASSGYATPGFENGSAFQNISAEAISVEPEIFSPSSGSPDFAMIAFNFDHAGYVANVKVVNQQGFIIKTIAENELLGSSGFFTWRGDTTNGSKATVGAYMVWFEAYDGQGKIVTLKKRVVVAEKF